MKRMICLLTALLLCMTAVIPAYASEDEFVPSISYKDGPEIEDAELNEEEVGPCLIVTSIREAEEKITDIPQESRDLLLEIYEELLEDEMELPLEDKDYVVIELVDVSWAETTCVEEDHGHDEWLELPDTELEVTFELGIGPGTDVVVFVYVDDEWVPVDTENNEDGTISCIFEDICPVIFCVDPDDEVPPPDTGDLAVGEILLWGGMMLLSLLLLLLVLVMRRKEARQ